MRRSSTRWRSCRSSAAAGPRDGVPPAGHAVAARTGIHALEGEPELHHKRCRRLRRPWGGREAGGRTDQELCVRSGVRRLQLLTNETANSWEFNVRTFLLTACIAVFALTTSAAQRKPSDVPVDFSANVQLVGPMGASAT